MNLTQQQALGPLAALLPDVTLAFGEVPERIADATAAGVLWQVAAGRFLLCVPRVARYLIEGGARITVQPLCDDAARVARVLRMTPLAALLNQRGHLVLHAAAAANEQGAVVLAGHSCSGKSTLLAALLQRGWRLLADDLVVVTDEDGPGRIWPVSGELALWPAAAERLGYGAGSDGRLVLDQSARLAEAPCPLRAVLCLGETRGGEVEADPLPGAAAFRALSLLAYSNHVAEAILGPMALLLLAARLAGRVPVSALRRPRPAWTVDALVEQVQAAVAHG